MAVVGCSLHANGTAFVERPGRAPPIVNSTTGVSCGVSRAGWGRATPMSSGRVRGPFHGGPSALASAPGFSDMATEHHDVLIVGAGLSGVGAAVHLHQRCPGKSYLILEGRPSMGGTWDLFRYPGIRSDSDMHTLGYSFKPWREAKAIADGPSILRYVKETAAEYGVDEHIRYGHRATSAVLVERGCHLDGRGGPDRGRRDRALHLQLPAHVRRLLQLPQGYTPEFAGQERFRGTIIHPQKWPEDLDYAGKQVVVIGSGATAMTLVPAMARDVAHIVMLQRSPTYVVSRPDKDVIANTLRAVLPERWAYAITRWKNVALQQFLYRRTRTHPEQVKQKLLDLVRKELGPDYDVETHFTPRYNPWDQRLCLVPNSDLFAADPLRQGIDRHRPDRALHRDGHRARVRPAARGRHHRHRDRPQPRRARRDAVLGRRRAGRFRADLDLQGHDVLRRAEPGLHLRLHQRLVDAARRPHLRVRLPAAQPHGRERHAPGDAAPARRATATCRRARGSTASRPATCSG